MKQRILAFAAALAMVLGSMGCSTEETAVPSMPDHAVRNDEEQSSSLTVTVSHAYASEQVMEGLWYQTETWRVGDLTAVVSFTEDYENTLALFDPASDSIAASLTFPAERKPIGIWETADGWEICLLALQEDYSYAYYIAHCGSDWNVCSETDITAQFGAQTCVNAVRSDGSGNFAALTSGETSAVLFLDESFRELERVSPSVGWIHSILFGTDGELYAYYNTGGSEAVGRIDRSTLTLERLQYEGMPKSPVGIGEGNAACDLLVYDAEAAYGAADGTCTKIIDWLNSDFSSGFHVCALPEEHFFVTEYDVDTRLSSAWVLREKTQEELEQLELITLSMLSDDRSLEKAVNRYNRRSGDVRIVIENYAKYDTEGNWEESLAKFKQDMVENKVADIICTDGLPFASFANKACSRIFIPIWKRIRISVKKPIS